MAEAATARRRGRPLRRIQELPPTDLTRGEWERLCDGCGRCCVHKLHDASLGLLYYTNVACRLLDLESCRCKAYGTRHREVPECVDLYRCRGRSLEWLPSSCAYRLRAAGHALPRWHPLVTGDPESTRKAGMSVRGHVVAESEAGAMTRHIVTCEPFAGHM